MCVKNTENEYGAVAKGFHWVIGLTILGLLAVGFYMAGLENAPFKFKIYGIHKALGIAVLALAALRVVWRFINVQPSGLSTHQAWEKFLSKITHVVLYVAMLGMPLSGWVMSSAGGYPISFFGLFPIPPIVEKNPDLGGLASNIHSVLGYALVIALGLHIAGAAKHHILDRDTTLSRMVHNNLGLVSGLFILVLGAVVLGAATYFGALRLLFS